VAHGARLLAFTDIVIGKYLQRRSREEPSALRSALSYGRFPSTLLRDRSFNVVDKKEDRKGDRRYAHVIRSTRSISRSASSAQTDLRLARSRRCHSPVLDVSDPSRFYHTVETNLLLFENVNLQRGPRVVGAPRARSAAAVFRARAPVRRGYGHDEVLAHVRDANRHPPSSWRSTLPGHRIDESRVPTHVHALMALAI